MGVGYANSSPYEIIGAPFTAWIAAAGSTKPVIDNAVGSPWILIGSSGNLNQTEEGITVEHRQTIVDFRAAGDAGTRKRFRTEEQLLVRFTIADLKLEQYMLALEHNTVTTVAPSGGVVGYKWVGLSRNLVLTARALLLRGPSPYGDLMVMQYFLPLVQQSGNPTPVFRKGEAAGLAFEYSALVDVTAATDAERFGRLEAQHLAS